MSTRSATARVGVLVLAIVLAGCSAGSAPAPAGTTEVAASSLSAPVSTSELAAAGLLADADIDVTSNARFGILASEQTASDRYGEFTPVRLADDAPILTYDLSGPWAEITDWLDPQYVSDAVATGARFFVDEWLDSPARWDDTAEAWAGVNTAVGTLRGAVGQDVRAAVASGDGADRLFDLADWREELGLRPAEYVPGVPRISIADIQVTDMAVYAPNGDSGDLDDIGLSVTYEVSFSEPVVNTDGDVFGMQQALSLTLSSLQSTGLVDRLHWDGTYSVARKLSGEMSTLPTFATSAGVPEGWQVQALGRLTYATPPGAAVSSSSDDGASPAWTEYALNTRTATGDDVAYLWVRDAVEVEESAACQWNAVDRFENYGLELPGVACAAAEVGADTYGRFRVRLFFGVEQNGEWRSYRMEWDTTPSTAEQELSNFAGALSIASS